MFGLITRRRHEWELAAAADLVTTLRDEREQALMECQAFKAAAKTAARQFCEATDALRPIDGGTARPAAPSAELRQARAQARALEARLTELQAANEARDRADMEAAL
ncbi:hypothetical protein G3I51_13455 [Streptomyces sp. SID9944]|nr:hypothetical protein [Streptomyces sp. SID9944]